METDCECKTCPKCRAIREVGEFSKNSTSKDGLNYWCKYCQAEYRKSTYCPKKNRDYFLSRRYNLTHGQYIEMYEEREGECDICGDYHETLCIDHEHSTGKIRGLLCQECNKALGLFYDNPLLIQSAIDYLLN
jgi:hypothetical protein